MIEILTGDMFDYPADARVNAVNCVGVMGKGIALQFAQRYPEMLREYRKLCRSHQLRPGDVHTHEYPSIKIINVATKSHWRDNSHYDWIDSCLVNLAREIQRLDVRQVTVPALGCTNGGLEWSKVLPMMQDRLRGLLHRRIMIFQPWEQ